MELEFYVEKQEGQAQGLFIKNNFSVSLWMTVCVSARQADDDKQSWVIAIERES